MQVTAVVIASTLIVVTALTLTASMINNYLLMLTEPTEEPAYGTIYVENIDEENKTALIINEWGRAVPALLSIYIPNRNPPYTTIEIIIYPGANNIDLAQLAGTSNVVVKESYITVNRIIIPLQPGAGKTPPAKQMTEIDLSLKGLGEINEFPYIVTHSIGGISVDTSVKYKMVYKRNISSTYSHSTTVTVEYDHGYKCVTRYRRIYCLRPLGFWCIWYSVWYRYDTSKYFSSTKTATFYCIKIKDVWHEIKIDPGYTGEIAFVSPKFKGGSLFEYIFRTTIQRSASLGKSSPITVSKSYFVQIAGPGCPYEYKEKSYSVSFTKKRQYCGIRPCPRRRYTALYCNQLVDTTSRTLYACSSSEVCGVYKKAVNVTFTRTSLTVTLERETPTPVIRIKATYRIDISIDDPNIVSNIIHRPSFKIKMKITDLKAFVNIPYTASLAIDYSPKIHLKYRLVVNDAKLTVYIPSTGYRKTVQLTDYNVIIYKLPTETRNIVAGGSWKLLGEYGSTNMFIYGDYAEYLLEFSENQLEFTTPPESMTIYLTLDAVIEIEPCVEVGVYAPS